jgi:hypothetical protein
MPRSERALTKLLLNRRTFLKDAGALTVSAAVMAAGASAVASTAALDGLRIRAVLFDSRYSSCRGFADALVRKGAVAFDARSDVAGLWYGSLRDHVARYGGSVAGLTGYSDFVVSESMGRELRLSLRYEGSHDCRESRILTHRLRSFENAGEVESALRSADSDWAQALAHALARTPSAGSVRQCKSSVVYTSQLDDHPGFLRSWLLAPA